MVFRAQVFFLLTLAACGREQDVRIFPSSTSREVALEAEGLIFEVAPRELHIKGPDLDLMARVLDDRVVIFDGAELLGECTLRNCDALVQPHYDAFVLASNLLSDPEIALEAREKYSGGGTQLQQAMITGGEAYWCGVGMMGAAVVGGPVGAFAYAMVCGLWADMDSW